MNTACKDCTERYVGCHSECEKYQAYLDELYDMREKIRKGKMDEREFKSYKKRKDYKRNNTYKRS